METPISDVPNQEKLYLDFKKAFEILLPLEILQIGIRENVSPFFMENYLSGGLIPHDDHIYVRLTKSANEYSRMHRIPQRPESVRVASFLMFRDSFNDALPSEVEMIARHADMNPVFVKNLILGKESSSDPEVYGKLINVYLRYGKKMANRIFQWRKEAEKNPRFLYRTPLQIMNDKKIPEQRKMTSKVDNSQLHEKKTPEQRKMTSKFDNSPLHEKNNVGYSRIEKGHIVDPKRNSSSSVSKTVIKESYDINNFKKEFEIFLPLEIDQIARDANLEPSFVKDLISEQKIPPDNNVYMKLMKTANEYSKQNKIPRRPESVDLKIFRHFRKLKYAPPEDVELIAKLGKLNPSFVNNVVSGKESSSDPMFYTKIESGYWKFNHERKITKLRIARFKKNFEILLPLEIDQIARDANLEYSFVEDLISGRKITPDDNVYVKLAKMAKEYSKQNKILRRPESVDLKSFRIFRNLKKYALPGDVEMIARSVSMDPSFVNNVVSGKESSSDPEFYKTLAYGYRKFHDKKKVERDLITSSPSKVEKNPLMIR